MFVGFLGVYAHSIHDLPLHLGKRKGWRVSVCRRKADCWYAQVWIPIRR